MFEGTKVHQLVNGRVVSVNLFFLGIKPLVPWCLGGRIINITVKYRAKIDEVIKFIIKRPDEELAALNVARLADIFQIERTTLAREFKFHREVTLEYYLCREKIIRAAYLLVYQAGDSIGQIAERMGFCSCQYFSRVFEKFFGVKPCKYRKYQQLRSGIKDRRVGEVKDRRIYIRQPSIGLSERRSNKGDRRKGVKDRRTAKMEIRPIVPVKSIYPAYSIQGLLRMMRENETA